MIIELGEFVLRKASYDDAAGFIEICAEKETMKYYGVAGAQIRTVEDAKDQIDWCNNLFEENGGRWIITEKGDDRYIGDIGFSNFAEEHLRAEIGFRLMRKYQGRGIVSTCIGALLKYGFAENGYNRVEALVDSRNEPSRKVLLKNNFTFEGRLREYEIDKGSFVDIEVFSILKKEFMP